MEKQADLRKWFKEKWVDISRKNPDGSHPECGRDEAKLGKKGYPKCRPKAKAAQMTKKEKSYAVRAKRSKRQGVGGKPTMVPTEKPEKQTKTAAMDKIAKNVPTDPAKWSQAKAQAKAKFDVYPSAYANGWAAKKYKAMGGGWKKEAQAQNTMDTPMTEEINNVAGIVAGEFFAKVAEKLDPVGQEDKDIDNDGDHDSSDKYLAKRRKAIGKAMSKRKGGEDMDKEAASCGSTDQPEHKRVPGKAKKKAPMQKEAKEHMREIPQYVADTPKGQKETVETPRDETPVVDGAKMDAIKSRLRKRMGK